MAPIGGIAMVPLAALLVEAGHQVTDSDGELYPPMSTLLESLQIPLFRGFSADHVPLDCDAMIVGNAATRDNPEAAEALREASAKGRKVIKAQTIEILNAIRYNQFVIGVQCEVNCWCEHDGRRNSLQNRRGTGNLRVSSEQLD